MLLTKPKILFIDFETSPLLAWTWGRYQQDVLRVDQESFILCFSHMWDGEDEAKVVAQTDFPAAYTRSRTDDRRVVAEAWRLMDEADIVVAHNIAFDERKIHARFAVHGLTPPSVYRTVCTLKTARKHLKFSSNRLGDLGEVLGLGRKEVTGGLGLWFGCMAGDPFSWQVMRDYAKRDTELLANVYHKLLPYVEGINYGLFSPTKVCKNCGSDDLSIGRTPYRTRVSSFRTYVCRMCGTISRERTHTGERPKLA